MKFAQHELSVGPMKRGCHLIHGDVLKAIQPTLKDFDVGLCHVFCQHTSCSITINEVLFDCRALCNKRLTPPAIFPRLDSSHARALLRGEYIPPWQNADPDVRVDTETFLNQTVPEASPNDAPELCPIQRVA